MEIWSGVLFQQLFASIKTQHKKFTRLQQKIFQYQIYNRNERRHMRSTYLDKLSNTIKEIIPQHNKKKIKMTNQEKHLTLKSQLNSNAEKKYIHNR